MLERARVQARRQHVRKTDTSSFELRRRVEAKDFDLMPATRPGDLFDDIEGDPHHEAGLEYLHGVWSDGAFRAFWARDHAEEAHALAELPACFRERLGAYPEAWIYHYTPYQITALRRLTTKYGVGEAFLGRFPSRRRPRGGGGR